LLLMLVHQEYMCHQEAIDIYQIMCMVDIRMHIWFYLLTKTIGHIDWPVNGVRIILVEDIKEQKCIE
jgi:hypothetical protein